jgi:hypothetical protein
MGKYTKTNIVAGQTIASIWGNAVQEQFEDVVGIQNNEITEFLAAIIQTDTRTVAFTRTGGVITKIELKDGPTVVVTYTINRTGGQITSITEAGGGRTVTYTLNRTAGQVTSITKGVV